MKTAIYIYSSTEVSIATEESGLQLELFGGGAQTLAAGNVTLSSGIYRVFSAGSLGVSYGSSADIEIVTGNDKDVFPKPKPRLQALPPGYTGTTFDAAFDDFMGGAAKGLTSISATRR